MLTPLNPTTWDVYKAAHLLDRAGFGGSPEQIEALYKLGLKGAVEFLLVGKDDYAAFPPPAWAKPHNLYAEQMELRKKESAADAATRKMMQKQKRREEEGDFRDLVVWWMNRMRYSSYPLREKLTLFWHGHFATSMQKVRNAYYMWQQNDTLRRNALGNFRTMMKDISKDPAMMVWLDTDLSEQTHPNENFGRESLELFTIGVGNFTEADMHANSRAFTGYRIDKTTETFRYAPALHDDRPKTLFGKTANYDGDSAIDQILAQPLCAPFLAKKLLRFFVIDNPKPALIAATADRFRAANYAITPLMREIFLSAEFYAPAATNTQIKSPVQFIVQAAKELEMELPEAGNMINALRQLGQMPFEPPNVKGWDGGKKWITTSTLFFRYNYANTMLSGKREFDADMPLSFMNIARVPSIDFAKIAPANLRRDPTTLVHDFSWRLLQRQLPMKDGAKLAQFIRSNNMPANDQTLHELLHLLMSTPQYQLT